MNVCSVCTNVGMYICIYVGWFVGWWSSALNQGAVQGRQARSPSSLGSPRHTQAQGASE